ncbi:putative tetratricopeptide-like helical domain superfamily [Helianthus debilis subsp. tardiflorus]
MLTKPKSEQRRSMMTHLNSRLQGFIKLTGNFIANPFLPPLKYPLSSSRLGLDFSPHSTSLASLLHSISFSNNGDHPLSRYQKVTSLDDAFNLFDEMIQRKPLPSVMIKFNQLLNAVTKLNHFSSCLHLFKQMYAVGVPVDKYSMNIAIKCCCQMSRTYDGFALLGCCFRRAVVPDVFTFSTLLDGLIREDRIIEAERLFKRLIKHRLCEPNVVTYNTMIKGLCKFGNNDIAIGLLRLMDERGCKPDIYAYSTIIDSLCKDKMIEDAFKLFNEMVFAKGIQPDVITYTSLIHGLCNLCRWNEVSKLLKEMEEDVRISPDIQTLSILVDAFCKEGRVDEAEAVIDIMVERGEGLFRVARCGDARKLFDEMRAAGQIPNEYTYGVILDGLCNNHQVEEALSLFHLVGESKLNYNIVVYNILIEGASKCGKLDTAKTLFHDLTLKGLQPDVRTFNIMISGLCREGQLKEAKLLFLKMDESGCPPDTVTYNVLLQGYLRNKHFDDVEMLLHEMDGRSYSLDASSLSLLIDQIAAGSLDRRMIELIGRLVPKEMMNIPA